MFRRFLPVWCIAALHIASLAGGSAADQAARIFIGSHEVDMKGVTPAMLSNTVLAPVRPIAEALGAKLKWDESAKTLTVLSNEGSAVLRVGDSTGTVKGSRIVFPTAPFLFYGRVFAPIIFFNEMFDMALIWDPFRQELRWMPIVPPRPSGITRPPIIIYGPGRPTPEGDEAVPAVPATRTLVGEVISVIPSKTNPKVVVRAAGKTVTYPLARDAVILRGRVGGRGTEVPLSDVRPGDRVTLRFDNEGKVVSIRAQFRMLAGKIKSTAEGTILMETGETLKITPQTKIILPGNVLGDTQDVHAGDTIVASVSPVTGMASIIKVQPPLPNPEGSEEQEDQISLNTVGPLRAGDLLVVTFKGTPGGKAVFAIPGVKVDIPMTEAQPAIYRGEYLVKSGDLLIKQRIQVTFTPSGKEAYVRQSRLPVTIRTVAGYLPRIVYPHPGQQIESPIVVSGLAEPGALVRISIEYRRDVQGIFPVEGLVDIEEVKANEEGFWETTPMSAVTTLEPPRADFGDFWGFDWLSGAFRLPREEAIVYTITAATIGPNGEPQASYSIDVTKDVGKTVVGVAPPSVESYRYLVGASAALGKLFCCSG